MRAKPTRTLGEGNGTKLGTPRLSKKPPWTLETTSRGLNAVFCQVRKMDGNKKAVGGSTLSRLRLLFFFFLFLHLITKKQQQHKNKYVGAIQNQRNLSKTVSVKGTEICRYGVKFRSGSSCRCGNLTLAVVPNTQPPEKSVPHG